MRRCHTRKCRVHSSWPDPVAPFWLATGSRASRLSLVRSLIFLSLPFSLSLSLALRISLLLSPARPALSRRSTVLNRAASVYSWELIGKGLSQVSGCSTFCTPLSTTVRYRDTRYPIIINSPDAVAARRRQRRRRHCHRRHRHRCRRNPRLYDVRPRGSIRDETPGLSVLSNRFPRWRDWQQQVPSVIFRPRCSASAMATRRL